MPTDDERRDVAKNCYEAAYRELFTGENVARAIGTHTSGTTLYDHDAWSRLKALIEPSLTTPVGITVGEEQMQRLVRDATAKVLGVDYHALLALAGEMEAYAMAADYEGAGVVNSSCLEVYADRIRDALEVSL